MNWEELVTKAKDHFSKADPKLHEVLVMIDLPKPNPICLAEEFFERLCADIVGQQLSGKAADTIFNRFKALFPNGLLPETILKEADEKLRGVGLSNAKTKYIKDLAQRVLNQDLHLHSLVEMKDEEVIAELVKVKGIGNWTAEMFLIFTLQRPDVYSLGDLGLTKAVMKLYGYKEKPTADQLLKHSKIWSPYRSIASRALWKYLDTPNERTVGK